MKAKFCYLILIMNIILINKLSANDALHTISKRFVLFPQYSVVQITAGLSIPLILPRRSINLSVGFQMNHDLPYNFTNFEPIYGRLNELNHFDFDRKTMYEYVINIIESFGLDGEDCLLRAICEVSEIPLEINEDDNLLEQILHFLLTPSKDFIINDHGLGFNTSTSSLEHKVLVAERLGRIHGECTNIFDCPISLLDLLTNKFY